MVDVGNPEEPWAMTTILIIVLIVLLLGGGGGYYVYNAYGGAGLGGALGLVLFVLLVLWLLARSLWRSKIPRILS
jgi:hypothetical protein